MKVKHGEDDIALIRAAVVRPYSLHTCNAWASENALDYYTALRKRMPERMFNFIRK